MKAKRKRGYHGDGETCPACGVTYKSFKSTIGTFAEAKAQLYKAAEENPNKWRHKTLGCVLGHWHAVKQAEWTEHKAGCLGNDPCAACPHNGRDCQNCWATFSEAMEEVEYNEY